MAKSANGKTKRGEAAAPAIGATTSGPNGSLPVADADVARRAYDLYLARGGEPGHDVEDWLQAERDLRDAAERLMPDRQRAS